MGRILDEFSMGIFCSCCKTETENHVTKEDEQENGEYIAYYAQCDICKNIEEMTEQEVWAIGNGFKKEYCGSRRGFIFIYKGYDWNQEELNTTSIQVLKDYKKVYDKLDQGEMIKRMLEELE